MSKLMEDPDFKQQLKTMRSEKLVENGLKQAKKAKKALQDATGKPKVPPNQFLRFVKENYAEMKQRQEAGGQVIKPQNVIKALAESYAQLSPEQKDKYRQGHLND